MSQDKPRRLFQDGETEFIDTGQRYEIRQRGRRIWQSSYRSALDYTATYAKYKEMTTDATQ